MRDLTPWRSTSWRSAGNGNITHLVAYPFVKATGIEGQKE
jgi:hypothetical protein